MQKNEFYRAHEVAALFGVSKQTLGNWRKLGKGPPFIQLGNRSYRYRKAAVDGYLAALERGENSAGQAVADYDKETAAKKHFTCDDLHRFINESIKAGRLTVTQAKRMQREMNVARVRDLDTPGKVKKAKTMIDGFIKAQAEGSARKL